MKIEAPIMTIEDAKILGTLDVDPELALKRIYDRQEILQDEVVSESDSPRSLGEIEKER